MSVCACVYPVLVSLPECRAPTALWGAAGPQGLAQVAEMDQGTEMLLPWSAKPSPLIQGWWGRAGGRGVSTRQNKGLVLGKRVL